MVIAFLLLAPPVAEMLRGVAKGSLKIYQGPRLIQVKLRNQMVYIFQLLCYLVNRCIYFKHVILHNGWVGISTN